MSANSPLHVLGGFKVLDFTQFVAGPTSNCQMLWIGRS
jgi:hypothetical protein